MKIYNLEIDDKIIENINNMLNETFFDINFRQNVVYNNKTMFKHLVNEEKLEKHKETLKKEIEKIYIEEQIGLKLIVKILNNNLLTYPVLRKVFKKLDIEVRKGQSILTKNISSIRSINAINKGTWKNWPEKYPHLQKNSKRSNQGYYLNKSKNKYVWLRSSWEYGYAKYLDENNIVWDVECNRFLLKNGEYYRPDFFIFNNKDVMIKIVEIKSSYNYDYENRLSKYWRFKEEYLNIDTELFLDGDLFKEIKTTQSKLIREWNKTLLKEKPENV